MELASREVIGYALSQSPNAQLAKDALDDAIKKQRPVTSKLLFHYVLGHITPAQKGLLLKSGLNLYKNT